MIYIEGFGGCPMAKDDLTGNIATEEVINFFAGKEELELDMEKWQEAVTFSNRIFS